MLEDAKGDHGHERMAVQASLAAARRPLRGGALEMVETAFLLHLLVGLIAAPSIAGAIDPSPSEGRAGADQGVP